MAMAIAIGVRIPTIPRASGGMVASLPLSAPRDLAYQEHPGNPGRVVFSWRPPLHWGPAGPHPTDRYQYEFRLEGNNGNLNPWTGMLSDHNDLSISLSWAAAHSHPPNRIQFRVRSRDANGATSGWVESPVLTEDQVNPRRGPFSRQFSRQFQGGGA